MGEFVRVCDVLGQHGVVVVDPRDGKIPPLTPEGRARSERQARDEQSTEWRET